MVDLSVGPMVAIWRRPFALAAFTLLATQSGFTEPGAPPAGTLQVRAVSSRPDTVSGDTVLVEVVPPMRSGYSATLNGRDVTSSFRISEDSGRLLALLTGLAAGDNHLEVRTNSAGSSEITLVNHPLQGPVFSGPHQQPFICETAANGLAATPDVDCNTPTVVQYYYKSARRQPAFGKEAMIASLTLPPGSLAAGFKRYDPGQPLPTDVAKTVTSEGRAVNYVVRREIGVINRGVYDIQFLHQPGEPLPNPWKRPRGGWNGRAVYVFGGGCGAGYRQGTLGIVGKTQEPLLSQGYAVATSTLNIFGNNCNDQVSAETLSMVKEHFIESFGEPIHTIGWGSSGGAMQVYLISQNYPGLLDGIVAASSFPDMTSTIQSVSDCALLRHAFGASGKRWTEEQKGAVSGFATWRTCDTWGDDERPFPILNPQAFCPAVVPQNIVYDPVNRPKGLRCDFYDNEVNFFGRDIRTGFAQRPLDNEGVQYGLVAFNNGEIDADQFIELNEHIGGFDFDGNITPRRTEADSDAVKLAYQHGLVLTGNGLSQIPIIDWRQYSDSLVDNHDLFRSYVTRARIVAAEGTAENQVLLIDPAPDMFQLMTNSSWNDPDVRFVERERELVSLMDRWLDGISASQDAGKIAERIMRSRPVDLADGCRTLSGKRVVEPATYDQPGGKCSQLYPAHADPRIAAGGPLTDDVLKCNLKPISATDYVRSLNANQLQHLRSIFPGGVCDYSRSSVGRQVIETAWRH